MNIGLKTIPREVFKCIEALCDTRQADIISYLHEIWSTSHWIYSHESSSFGRHYSLCCLLCVIFALIYLKAYLQKQKAKSNFILIYRCWKATTRIVSFLGTPPQKKILATDVYMCVKEITYHLCKFPHWINLFLFKQNLAEWINFIPEILKDTLYSWQ